MARPILTSFALATQLLILASLCPIHAQSGRRLPRSQPTTSGAVTTSESENHPKSVKEFGARKLTHQVKLLVGRRLTSRRLPSEDTIYTSFIQRLNEFTNVTGTTIGEVKRQQAILRARAESESLVVLLQFEIDTIQDGKLVLKSTDLQVKYYVYAPATGKLMTEGKVYYQSIGGGGARSDNWPSGPPIRITAEATGLEAAERLHDWLLLGAPTKGKQ